MSGISKKRRVFWLTPGNSASVGERALALTNKGYDVQLFGSLDQLSAELESKRANVIIITDDAPQEVNESTLYRMMSMPEVQGARLILTTTQTTPKLNKIAACSNFRDIIPLDIDEKNFLMRFIFATAGRPAKFAYPAGQICLKNISAANFPARIIWISPTQIRLECRLKMPPGSALTIVGELADYLGVGQLSGHVIETHRSHLLYRFSEAILVEWQVPNAARDKAMAALEQLEAQSTGPRTRVFVAIQSSDLRIKILVRFNEPRFEVITAIQKQSIIDDPKFFTPDVVFIEDQLILEDGGQRFQQMLSNIAGGATIFVLGSLNERETWQQNFPQHRIIELPRDGQVITSNILAHHLPLYDKRPLESHTNTVHFAAENPLSLADVQIPARLTRIHPTALQIALPAPVSQFTLARIDSPIIHKSINRSPYVKITECYPDTHPDAAPFTFLADAYISDCSQNDRQILAAQLIRLVSHSYSELNFGAQSIEHSSHTSVPRIPELGSIKPETNDNLGKILTFPKLSSSTPSQAADPLQSQSGSPEDKLMPQINGPRLVLSSNSVTTFPDAGARSISNQTNATSGLNTPHPALGPLRGSTDSPQVGAEIDLALQRQARLAAQAAKRRQQLFKDLKAVLLFLSVLIGGLAMVWFVSSYIAPNWHRSGSIYSEQLMRFAPGGQQNP